MTPDIALINLAEVISKSTCSFVFVILMLIIHHKYTFMLYNKLRYPRESIYFAYIPEALGTIQHLTGTLTINDCQPRD